MKFNILTIFPEYFQSPLNTSLLKKAQDNGLLKFELINIRDFSRDKHRRVDDEPYGGGAGMVMMVQPIYDAVKWLRDREETYVVLTTPRGRRLDQNLARELSLKKSITIICGRYEGIDERVSELVVDEEISIGNYVTFGGEVAALVIIEAVARLVPGVVGREDSVVDESFYKGEMIEYPQYTRPYDFLGHKVPDVLLSGNHKKIKEWREKKSKEITELWRQRNEQDFT